MLGYWRIPAKDEYRGWRVSECPGAPKYARWQASQYGVNISAPSRETLKLIIDHKLRDRENGWR